MGAEMGRKVGLLELDDSKQLPSSCEWFEDETVTATMGDLEIECVKALRKELDTVFSPDQVKAHENLLKDIWTAFTGEPHTFQLKSKRWKEFGFQCEDPQTDVRGGGKLSMENLKYFLTHYPDSAMSLMRRQSNISKLHWRENWYPFSTVGVNVTDLVCRVLGIHRRQFHGVTSSKKSRQIRDLKPYSLWPSLVAAELEGARWGRDKTTADRTKEKQLKEEEEEDVVVVAVESKDNEGGRERRRGVEVKGSCSRRNLSQGGGGGGGGGRRSRRKQHDDNGEDDGEDDDDDDDDEKQSSVLVYLSLPPPPKWQNAFSEIYCVAFMLLDRNFLECNASYFDFSHVICVTEEELTMALHQHISKPLDRIKSFLSIYPRAIRPPPPPGPAPEFIRQRHFPLIDRRPPPPLPTTNSAAAAAAGGGTLKVEESSSKDNTELQQQKKELVTPANKRQRGGGFGILIADNIELDDNTLELKKLDDIAEAAAAAVAAVAVAGADIDATTTTTTTTTTKEG